MLTAVVAIAAVTHLSVRMFVHKHSWTTHGGNGRIQLSALTSDALNSCPLVYTSTGCWWHVFMCGCGCAHCGSVSTLCEQDIDSILTGCWLSSLREDEACLDVRWESQRRGVMRQSDREAEREGRAYVRAEDDDNKLSVSADTNTALSGSDYLQDCCKM